MNGSGHPTLELTGLLRRIVHHCIVDGGWGAQVLDEVVTQALKGWTSDGRRWSRLDRTVAASLAQNMLWRGVLNERPAQAATLEAALRDALASEIQSRAFSNLPGRHHVDGAEVLALLGTTDAREAWRWLWDSPYVEPLAREMWDELSPDLLPRTLRSFLVRAPEEAGFIGRLPALTARTLSDPNGPDGTTLHFLRERVNTADMTGTYTINWCTCLATRYPDRPVAVSGGYVIRQPRRGSSDAEFFERCDAESQELASMADALINRHGPVHQLFDEGPLLYLEQWEVAQGERGRGLGAAVLERHLGRLRAEFRGLSTVVLQHAPAGFPQPFDMEAPDEICDEYARGVAGLMSYWERRQPYRVLGAHARSIAFDVARMPGHEEQLRMLVRHTGLD